VCARATLANPVKVPMRGWELEEKAQDLRNNATFCAGVPRICVKTNLLLDPRIFKEGIVVVGLRGTRNGGENGNRAHSFSLPIRHLLGTYYYTNIFRECKAKTDRRIGEECRS